MLRILVAMGLAATVMGPMAAQAGNSHRHKHHSYYGAQMRHAPVALQRRAGPPWRGPNQCFTDEGYGRYASCDRGR
jgi:hypothetical protein